MSKMLPSTISEEDAKKSYAEARIFEWLKKMEWGNATVLHSLPLKDHIKNSFGEIDFVVICDMGVFCIEVKGGGVERKNGQWGFTGKSGTAWKNQGPFDQVQGNMKSLRKYLQDHLPAKDPILSCRFACGVMTPDCVIKSDLDTEIIPDISFNANMKESDLPAYIRKCFRYWTEEKHYGGKDNLAEEDINRLVTFLRGDFCFLPPLSVTLKDTESQLLTITEEQLAIMTGFNLQERMMIEGGAGTGKTLLATEQCRRFAAIGEKVLYLCFNRMIASYVREVFASEDLFDNIEVYTINELLIKVCGIKTKDIDDVSDSFFKEELPNTFLDKYSNTLSESEKYDRVIIDEGQDLMRMSSYLCINEFIKGGWDKGKWTIYFDPRQNLFVDDDEFKDIWETLRQTSAMFTLSVNCRNTKQIAQGNYAVTHLYKALVMRAEGEDVEYKTYANKADEANELFKTIRRLKSEGIGKKDIVILSYYRMDNPNSCLYGVKIPDDIGPILFNKTSDFLKCTYLRYYTIQAFKGMESKVVILLDIDEFSDREKCYLNYVGMSRARAYLEMFYDEKLYNERQQRLLESLIN